MFAINKVLHIINEGENYALPIESVLRIIHAPEVTKTPMRSDLFEGVFNNEGSIPLLNLNQRFKLDANTDYNTIIILNVDNRRIGLRVQSASDVIDVENEEMEAVPEDLSNPYVENILPYGDKYIMVLNVSKLVSKNEFEEFEELEEELVEE